MSQLPSILRDRLDELASVYAERLCADPTYAEMPLQARLDSTRTFVSFVAACVETHDEALYLEFMKRIIDERMKQGFGLEPLLLALDVLEELIIPLTDDLDDIRFLWPAFSKGRDSLALRIGGQMRESEARLQNLARAVESTHDAVVITDTKGTIQFVNPAFEQITGYTQGEATGQNPRLLKSGVQPAEFYATMWRTITAGEVWEGTVTNRRKDGSLYHARLTISPMRNAAGEVEQFVAIQHDVTEQKQTEVQLATLLERRAEQVRTSTEVAQEIAAAPELGELFKRVVTLIKERFGYYHAQIFRFAPEIKAVVLAAGYGATGAKMQAAGHRLDVGRGVVGTAAATGRPVLATDVAHNPDWIPNPNLPATEGELAVPITLRGDLLGILDVQSDRAGALTEEDQLLLEGLCGQIAIAIDTARLLAEVQRNADLLRSVLDATPDWIFVKDQNFRYTLANQGYANALHLHVGDLIGKDDVELGLPEELVFGNPEKGIRGFRTDETAVLQRGETIVNPSDPATIDGEIHLFHTFKTPLRDAEGNIVGVLGLSRDITELQAAESRIAAERNLMRTLIDNVPDLIYTKDLESRFTLANTAIMRQLGAASVEEVIGKSDFDYHPREFAEQYFAAEQEIIRAGRVFIGHEEEALDAQTGEVRWLSTTKVPLRNADGEVVGLVGIGRDITDLHDITHRLDTRARQLALVAEVASSAGSILDSDKLIQQVVNLVHKRFDLYYVGLFMLDEAGEWAILRAGTGTAGQRMLAQGHKLAVGGDSMISWSVLHNQARVALDVGADAVHFQNPLLPETRSEMALPLVSRGRVIGAMTIQSARPSAFDEEDVTVLQTMANQLASAIENARLFEQTEAALNDVRTFRQLAQTSGQGISMSTLEGDVFYANPTLCRLCGVAQPEDIYGAMASAFYPPDQQERLTQEILPTVVSGGKWSGELTLISTTGRATPTLQDIFLVRDESGDPVGIGNIITDITDRKRAEAEVQERLDEINALYRAMSREGWQAYRATTELAGGYLFDRVDVRPADDLWEPEIARAAEQASLVTTDSGQPKAVAPLAVRGGEIIGALGVYDDPEHPLSPEDLALIESVSEQVALALDAARLFEQTQASLQETDVLYRASQALGAADDEQAVLDAVARYALENGGHSATLSYIEVDAQGNPEWLELVATVFAEEADSANVFTGLRIPIARAPGASIWLEDPDHPLILEDIATDSRLSDDVRAMMQRQGWRTVVMLPLQPGDRWVGIISLTWAEPQVFTDRDQRIYQALRDQATVTLDGRRLLVESAQRAEDMRFLFEVTQTATSSTADLESALQSVANVLRTFLQDAHTDIFVPNDEASLLHVACSHYREPTDRVIPRDTGASVGWVAETLEPLILEDEAIQRFSDLEAGTCSAMVLPIAAGPQLGGVIRLQSERVGLFDAHTLQLLQTLGGALHAIIQNQRLLQEVTAANERLLEIDKLKSQFLANMSHELRTPLNSIIGFSRVMLKGIDGPLTDLQQQDLETIHGSGQHLLNLINDILDQSKLEAGKMELSCDFFQIGEVIKSVMSTAIALVKEKPIKLIQEVPADLPPVWGDEFRTRQVLLNLISNASKFTEEGSITVTADHMTVDDKPMICVSVTDTGIGIAEKDMSKLFQAFQQVDASMTRRVGGTGLGLPIAKSLIEIQGGTVWVKSEVGVGSVFSFTIPINPPPAQEEDAEEEPEPTPSLALEEEAPKKPTRTVMVLDDEAGVINLYRRYLANKGYTVVGTTEPDALEGLIAQHHPHMILLDVIMPNRDGWEVLASLKQRSETCEIPVIVCTIVDERERGLAAGAAEYLVKPFVEDDLVHAVERVESRLIEAVTIPETDS